jgi:hypothetical protein
VRVPVNSPGGTSVAGTGAPHADKIKASASVNPLTINSIDRFGCILLILSNRKLRETINRYLDTRAALRVDLLPNNIYAVDLNWAIFI